MREPYPTASRGVLVGSDHGEFMYLAGVLDAHGERLDDPANEWGVADNYTAAADLLTGYDVWTTHAVEVGPGAGENQCAIGIDTTLAGVVNLEAQQTPAGELRSRSVRRRERLRDDVPRVGFEPTLDRV